MYNPTPPPPPDLYLPLLPSKINGQLVFTLCRKCAELHQTEECTHRAKKRALTETWISTEVQKAVSLGYEVLQIHYVWNYAETTCYDHATGKGGLFANYMNELITVKMEASGYPSNVTTDEEKEEFIKNFKCVESVTLDPTKIKKNPGARAVAKLCHNNLWGKLAQRSIMSQHKYVRDAGEFFNSCVLTSMMFMNVTLLTMIVFMSPTKPPTVLKSIPPTPTLS